MATAKWLIATAYTAATFTAGELNSLASGGAALSTTVVSNSSALDTFGMVSFVVTVGGTTVANNGMTLFLLPLNQDGTTYGDGYASSTTTQPAGTYIVGVALPLVGITTGNTITGTIGPFRLPDTDFKLALGNNLSIALNATAALTLKYQTANISIV